MCIRDSSIYIYPDLGSIASLTGQRGDGHAVVEARILHIVASDPRAAGPCEKLVAHEGAHILAYEDWGATGTPMMGEGLAVWASSGYGGTSLTEWKRRIEAPRVPSIESLLGKSFRQMPENQSYPLAGLFVEMAVEELGVAKVRQHLYGATASNWDSACKGAGTTSQNLEATFRTLFGRR